MVTVELPAYVYCLSLTTRAQSPEYSTYRGRFRCFWLNRFTDNDKYSSFHAVYLVPWQLSGDVHIQGEYFRKLCHLVILVFQICTISTLEIVCLYRYKFVISYTYDRQTIRENSTHQHAHSGISSSLPVI